MTIDEKLDITIGLCNAISHIISHDETCQLPNFIIVHRTTKENNLQFIDNHIVMKISYAGVRSLSEIDDMLCVYIVCLLLCLLDSDYTSSILSSDGYKWLKDLKYDSIHDAVLKNTKTKYESMFDLINNHKCCVVRKNSINKHILDYHAKIGFAGSIMRKNY